MTIDLTLPDANATLLASVSTVSTVHTAPLNTGISAWPHYIEIRRSSGYSSNIILAVESMQAFTTRGAVVAVPPPPCLADLLDASSISCAPKNIVQELFAAPP